MANLRGNLPLLLLEVETVWQQGDTSSTWFKCFNLRQHQWKSFLCVGATESQGFATHYKFWTRNWISLFTCGIQNKSVIKDFGNKLQFLSHDNCLHHSTWSVMFVQTCINCKTLKNNPYVSRNGSCSEFVVFLVKTTNVLQFQDW